MKTIFLLITLIAFSSFYSKAQIINLETYSYLKSCDLKEFEELAKKQGLTFEIDSSLGTMSIMENGCIFIKPMTNTSSNEYYDLQLIVSTRDKINNSMILSDATEKPNKKGTWVSKDFLYVEWDLENPYTHEMWYKVLVYKKKS